MSSLRPESVFYLGLTIGVAALIGLVLCILLRPKWAHVDHDWELWRWTFAKGRNWLRHNVGLDLAALLGAFVVGVLRSDGQSLARQLADGVMDTVAVGAVGFVFVLLFYSWSASATMLQEQRKAVEVARRLVKEAQDRLIPGMAIEPRVRQHDNARIASVLVKNTSQAGVLSGCCARLVRVERLDGNNRVLYGADIQGYLSWSAEVGKGKYAEINTEGLLDVCFLLQPFQGGGKFALIPPLQGFFHEMFEYVLTLEVAAANSAPLTREFYFTVIEKNQHAQQDGSGELIYSPLPNIEFHEL